MIDLRFSLGEGSAAVSDRLRHWDEAGAVDRLWSRDTTLWAPDPPPPELADRLGWLDLPDTGRDALAGLEGLRASLPFWMTDLVLLGMGGSSLAPEVLARTLGSEALPLTLLDSTHPRAVRDLDWIHPANTIFVVASKSGTTLETLSLFRHFWSRTQEVVENPGAHFVAITDPDSELVELARERGFRRVFEAPPDVGGRFSALTPFGLVPAALMGMDIEALLAGAEAAAGACREPADRNPGFELGAVLAEMTRAGRDKVTFLTSSTWEAFPDWAEQLLAESTGKDGVGIVPVAHEPELPPEAYGPDRLVVGILEPERALRAAAEWGDADDAPERLAAIEAAGAPVVRIEAEGAEGLGALFFVWEVAVAMAGSALGIHPFNQPDVQLAKDLARRAMAGDDISPDAAADGEGELDLVPELPLWGHAGVGVTPQVDPDAIREAVEGFLRSVGPGDYVGLQAYLAGGDPEELETLQAIRAGITRATGAATTLGYGPRFLHSTGQLHKGGPDRGAFLQIVDDAAAHVHVPETTFTFHQLIRAQALGDLAALVERGRRALRLRVDADGMGLSRLRQIIESLGEDRG